MINRRNFIAKNFFSLTGFFLPRCVEDFSIRKVINNRFVLVYTEGLHLKLHEYGDGKEAEERIAQQVAKLKALNRIREEGFPVVLIGGGNMMCPSTANNFSTIESEFTNPSLLQYDAAIPGESELASGVEVWTKIAGQVNFFWLACNYVVRDTPFEKLVKPFIVKDFGGMRIGITGIGMQQGERGFAHGWESVEFIPPALALNRTAAVLKEKGCDWVVCFNHGGSNFDLRNSMDAWLAKESEQVDLIIGCHTRYPASGVRLYTNKSANKTAVIQISEQKNFLARIDFNLSVKGGNKSLTFNELSTSKKNAE
jgi:5'-nucleotidase